jgi:hypothetical protein
MIHPLVSRTLAYIVAIVAIVSISQVVLMKAAQASFSWCTGTAAVCFAQDTNGNGTVYKTAGTPIGTCRPMPTFMNDTTSSLKNLYTTAAATLTVYENNPCGGYLKTYSANVTINDVGWFWNDEISAFCIGPRGAGKCP